MKTGGLRIKEKRKAPGEKKGVNSDGQERKKNFTASGERTPCKKRGEHLSSKKPGDPKSKRSVGRRKLLSGKGIRGRNGLYSHARQSRGRGSAQFWQRKKRGNPKLYKEGSRKTRPRQI